MADRRTSREAIPPPGCALDSRGGQGKRLAAFPERAAMLLRFGTGTLDSGKVIPLDLENGLWAG